MAKQSAGIVLFRRTGPDVEVFLIHPGGPFFTKKDAGVWSIPKGEFLDDEDALVAAKREFVEETGQIIEGEFVPLTPVYLKSGKKIYAWAVEGDMDHSSIVSNFFEMEWPPRSGKKQSFPEADRAGWFDTETAKTKLNAAQIPLINELTRILGIAG